MIELTYGLRARFSKTKVGGRNKIFRVASRLEASTSNRIYSRENRAWASITIKLRRL